MFGLYDKVLIGSINIFKIVGIFFIVYGIVFIALERYWGLPWFYSIDQINGSINGFIVVLIGWVLVSNNIKYGIIIGIILLTLVIVELKIVFSLIRKKEKAFVGKKGIVTKEIKFKGKATFEGKEYRVFSDSEYIPKDENVVISKLRGGQIVVRGEKCL